MAQSGYVYIMHGIGTNLIKVGQTTNLQERMRTLQQSVPFSLQLISAQLVHDASAVERELLQRYSGYRTRGEWFALPEELLAQWPLSAAVKSFMTMKEPIVKEKASASTAAKAWLQEYLHAGPVAALDVLAIAKSVGITTRTLRRAKEALHVHSYKQGLTWYWCLTARHETASTAASPYEHQQ